MAEAVTLVGLLSEFGAVEIVCHRTDVCLAVAVILLPNDRRLMAVERTYREGINIIVEPTGEEVATAREGDLWELWNSPRCKMLHSII